MSTLVGMQLSGRYRLDAQIGSGGMSTVYRAFDQTLERQVAIKLMHREIASDSDQLERFRRDRKELATAKGVKLSPLLFVMKAVVIALREHPTLRSTLSPERDRLLVKDYFHLGIAVDTDQGLVVPVVRDQLIPAFQQVVALVVPLLQRFGDFAAEQFAKAKA